MRNSTAAKAAAKGTGEADLEVRKTTNDLARHKMIARLYADILVDMTVCDIEGWDKTEYITILFEILNHFIRKAE